jgi:uncharacterized membrane protein YvlD (DUF360 family)
LDKNKTRKVTYLRFFIQIAMLAGIYIRFNGVVAWCSYVAHLPVNRCFRQILLRLDMPVWLLYGLFTQVRKALKIKYLNLPQRVNEALNKLDT